MAGIYIHIPFCKQACSYCNFHFSTKLSKKEVVLAAIHKEIELRKDYLGGERIDTVYFGGGTPSLLSKEELEDLVKVIHSHFSLHDEVEYCFEANPDDLTEPTLIWLNESPINRLSIGIQSFQEADLTFMNRVHNADEAIRCVRKAQKIGFSNISLDLIFGSQTTTDDMWRQNLEIFFDLGVDHLSAYSLTIEEKTALIHRIQNGRIEALDEDRNYRQYMILQEMIEMNGFEQYELSNYCKNDRYSKHNTSYWLGQNYLGIGPSAHSYNGISRQWNVSNNNAYIKKVKNNDPYHQIELLSEIDKYNEYLINSLRTKWGINILKLSQKFSDKIVNHFNKQVTLLSANLVSLTKAQLLVKKEKLFQSDEIVRHLMMEV